MTSPTAGGTFPYDYLFKLLMIGDAGVGKVCVCMCSNRNIFVGFITYLSMYICASLERLLQKKSVEKIFT